MPVPKGGSNGGEQQKDPIWKPKTNIRFSAKLKQMKYAKSKKEDWADQIWFLVDVTGHGTRRWYAPLIIADQLEELGAVEISGDTPEDIEFTITDEGPFSFIKEEKDGKVLWNTDNLVLDGEEGEEEDEPAPTTTSKPQVIPADGVFDYYESAYAACVSIAARSLAAALDIPKDKLDQTAVHAGAATIMIDAQRRGLYIVP